MAFAWSINEEEYHGSEDTREAAIQDAIFDNDLEPGQKVWTGEIVKSQASNYLQHVSRILEDMQEQAYDEAGEWSEHWLNNVTPEQEAELSLSLRAAIDAWATTHKHHPSFYLIENTIEHEVPLAAPPVSCGEVPE